MTREGAVALIKAVLSHGDLEICRWDEDADRFEILGQPLLDDVLTEVVDTLDDAEVEDDWESATTKEYPDHVRDGLPKVSRTITG